MTQAHHAPARLSRGVHPGRRRTQPLLEALEHRLLLAADAPRTYKGVVFPHGDRSFADRVVKYQLGEEVKTPYDDPNAAIGPPSNPPAYFSMGESGSLIVEFTDNSLVDQDTYEGGADLFIFETGPKVEQFTVHISRDGQSWYYVGVYKGQPSEGLDIKPVAQEGDSFRFVKLTDIAPKSSRSPTAGPDIDAIGAIGTRTWPDLDATGLEWRAEGGFRAEYAVRGGNIPDGVSANIGLYWSRDRNFQEKRDTLAHLTPARRTAGVSVITVTPRSLLSNPPADARYLLLVVDPEGRIPKGRDERNNVRALALPAVTLIVSKKVPTLMETTGYKINLPPWFRGPAATGYRVQVKPKSLKGAGWITIEQGSTGSFVNRLTQSRLRATVLVGGVSFASAERAHKARFPHIDTISRQAAIVARMKAAWDVTKQKTRPGVRIEHGFWILLDTADGTYSITPMKEGDAAGDSQPPSIKLKPQADHIRADSAVYTVAHFHTHTSPEYLPRWSKLKTGPSERDCKNIRAFRPSMPAFVYDYDPPGGWIRKGQHRKGDPGKIFRYGAVRRGAKEFLPC